MKKILALMLALALAVPFASCGNKETPEVENTQKDEVKVITHDEFVAAELETPVVVETYVQAKQSWWDNKGTFYMQSEDGAYFVYEMACTEEEYNKLIPGTKVRISGFKAEWSGEVEIIDAKYEILDGSYIATAYDATALLGKEELAAHQNELVAFKGLTVKSVNFKNDEPGDDIYVTLSLDDADYNFCVEAYLTNAETEVYKTVSSLNAGDKVDVEAFLYWYNGANPHITAVTVTEEAIAVMSHDEYIAAELDSPVVVETYVQAKQSWWENKGTFYMQSEDGAYFVYEMACTEEEYNKLVPGTKVRISGFKAEWSGEIEIVDAKFEILEGEYIPEVLDATALLGTEELIAHQNELVTFKGMTLKSFNYKNDTKGEDIYVNLTYGENEFTFVVESYLTNAETEVYKAFDELKAGDIVDITGYLYWYNAPNTHITSISVSK